MSVPGLHQLVLMCGMLYATHGFAEPLVLDVADASAAWVERDGQPLVVAKLRNADAFTRFTEQNVGRKLDIRVDGKSVNKPLLTSPIRSNSFQIVVPTTEDAISLAKRLQAGTAKLEIEVANESR
jgi:preprotein translocase subunit SecD